jgi:hypothetical protein
VFFSAVERFIDCRKAKAKHTPQQATVTPTISNQGWSCSSIVKNPSLEFSSLQGLLCCVRHILFLLFLFFFLKLTDRERFVKKKEEIK